HRSPTYENLNRDWAGKLHFHIMNGDWLYEELRTYPPEAWRLVQGVDKLPKCVEVMPTVVGVWENYKLYLSRGVELAKWHRHVPSFFTFNDRGNKNSYVYDIVQVIDPHAVRLHMPAKATDQVSYSIGRRSYGKFRVSNCEFFLLDTRGDRQMHDVKHRDKPGLSMIGTHQR